jgi:arabinan endo-1,5-alpha-L-arabinosidase
MIKPIITLIIIFFNLNLSAQEYQANIPVHDPVMIRQGDTFYLFCTGRGIAVWSSKDKKTWKKEPPVFAEAPAWAVKEIPAFKGHIWAPDIYFKHNRYYLYYSVSAFGKNTSAIGVLTNKTLDPSSPDFKWTDHGKVIQSFPGKTNWNAIDPNVITDDKDISWMVFGSFWDGIKLVKLDKDLLLPAEDVNTIPTIASRKKDPGGANPAATAGNPVDAGGNAIEAPFLFRKDNYYYLFTSVDYCCKGESSTYKMIVGRAKSIKGPYLDKDGVPMTNGGGTLLLQGDVNWHGVGHNAVVHDEGKDYLIFHGYDAKDKGISKLRITTLDWVNGWPVVTQ